MNKNLARSKISFTGAGLSFLGAPLVWRTIEGSLPYVMGTVAIIFGAALIFGVIIESAIDWYLSR